jgi:hypothetical protein
MRRQVTTITTVLGLALGPAAVTAGAVPARDPVAAVVAAKAAQVPTRVTDPRSPDARDAATTLVIPRELLPATQAPAVAAPHNDGFGWSDAGIGAGGLVVVALLAVGAGVGIQHRHRRQAGTPLAG